MHRRWTVVAGVLASLPLTGILAQDVSPERGRQPPVSAQGRLPIAGCAGQPISDVVVITQPPYTERLPQRLEFLRRAARDMHSTTKEDVIRGYLLLHRGDPCNQIRRAESERILRAQPFLVDARIRVYDDEAGGVLLEVETRDEFSLTVTPRISTAAPTFRAFKVGDTNLLGSARSVSGQWKDGGAYSDGLGVAYSDHQFGGGRNEFRVVGARLERGQVMRAEIVRPYYTDLQRFAFVSSVNGERNYFGFRRPGDVANAVNVAQQSALLGGLARIGPVGRLRLVGLSLTHLNERVDPVSKVITREGFLPDSGRPLDTEFLGRHVARINGLFGLRLLRFTPVQGFDALTGTQDMPIGLQFHLVYGRSLVIGAARDRDRFFASGLYVGAGGPTSFVGAQIITEARNDRGSRTWDNHVASGRLAWYFRPAVRQLTLVSAEWSAGRDMRTPFQLSLSDIDGGIHGYRRSLIPGAQRAVVRAEQRLVVPSRLHVADVGLAGFVEAGRLWGEHSVPYSETTPVRGAIGVSLLAAVPPRSRRLWRLDFALPLGNDPMKRFEIRISNQDKTRVFWKEPRDVLSGRESTVPTALFAWP